MPVNLNPDALAAAHRHCADEGDIGNLARGLLSAAAQLEAMMKTKHVPEPEPDPDEDNDALHFPAPPPPTRKKTHVSPPRHRK